MIDIEPSLQPAQGYGWSSDRVLEKFGRILSFMGRRWSVRAAFEGVDANVNDSAWIVLQSRLTCCLQRVAQRNTL